MKKNLQYSGKQPAPISVVRLIFTLVVLQVGFLLLIGKLFTLQFLDREASTETRADWRSRDKQSVKRGKILDRHGHVLGISQDRLWISADPRYLNAKNVNLNRVAAELADVLGADKTQLLAQLRRKQREFVSLQKNVDYEALDAIRNLAKKYSGIRYKVKQKRIYPKGPLAAQVIGYLNEAEEGEGVEFYYNNYLQKQHRVPLHRSVNVGSPGSEARQGAGILGNYACNVALTLDEYIQDIAEKALAIGCRKWNAPRGTAIVLAVSTSEILAMASYPSYDLNNYAHGNEETKRNLGIWYTYEPGSIFKIVGAAAALNEGIMNPSSSIFCQNGRYRLPNGRTVKDVSAKGWLTLAEVLHKSSNIGMIKIVQRLGHKQFQAYIKRFGFGKLTGIDLPYEQIGNLYALSHWDANSLGSIPYGQGIAVTPLQMVNALNVIANGGILRRPYITKEIRDGRGNLIKKVYPIEMQRVLRPEIAKQMTDILTGVVENGSGRRAKIEGYLVAGKTGTAQKAERGKGYAAGKEVMSFMGFLPADDPQIAIIVTIDEPKGARYSSQVAAPIFKQIATQAIQYIEQTDFFEYGHKNDNVISRRNVNTSDANAFSSDSVPRNSLDLQTASTSLEQGGGL